MTGVTIGFRNISKTYANAVQALQGVTLEVAPGEILAVLGRSGSGKSTLLRVAAGLETPEEGDFLLDGRVATGLAPRERGVGMVFQNPALLPHLTVAANLGFGAGARGVSRVEVDRRAREVATALGLSEVLTRRPQTLSGGQRQRVAIGRALVGDPRILLLDEPFSGLDVPLRASIRDDLRRVLAARGVTTVWVTHDQAEALAHGDRVAILEEGRLIQVGSPRALYESPPTRWVASFVGSPAIQWVEGRLEGDRLAVTGLPLRDALVVPASVVATSPPRRRLALGVRPEWTRLGPPSDGNQGSVWLDGTHAVERLEFQGATVVATVAVGSTRFQAVVPSTSSLAAGDRVSVGFELGRLLWFDGETGQRIETEA